MQLPAHMLWLSRGWLNANQLLLTGGDGPALIDTGHIGSTDETFHLLQTHGVAASELKAFVNTHSHLDHFGGNHAIRRHTQAPLLCSPLTAQFFADNDHHSMWLLDYERRNWPLLNERPVQANETLHAGERVELGTYRFEVVPIPGHAPDMIALFQPETKVLVCADAMVFQDSTVMNTLVWPDAIEQAIDSLERLRSLKASIALPGHGPILTDVEGNINTVITLLRKFQEQPEKHRRHTFSRAMMFLLLVELPLPREQIEVIMVESELIQNFADFLSVPPQALVTNTLDSFLARGSLVQDNDGLLRTTIAA